MIPKTVIAPEMEEVQERYTNHISRQQRNGQAVWIKQYVPGEWLHPGETLGIRVSREVDLLRLLADSFPRRRRLGLTKLVESDSDKGLLVIEEVPGRVLQELAFGEYRNKVDFACKCAFYLAG